MMPTSAMAPERPIPGVESVTLRELLKQKAEEGVAVLVMLWNDRTFLPILEDIGSAELKLFFTHHQKVVSVNASVVMVELARCVQVFRSIDDASVVGFPSDPSQAEKMGLVTSQNCTFEQSIHSAYIEAIRRAKHFIDVENQYFFGGCATWSQDQDCGCLNLVPMEITLKVADNIRDGNRFASYIVTPMWPEGKPESDIVQGMVHWNRLTMEMMYHICGRGHRGKEAGGQDKKVFLEVESLECVKAVGECAEELWIKFMGEEVVDLPGHLLSFPVRVDETGNMSNLTVDGLFPNTKALVRGKKWTVIEPVPHEIADLLTTWYGT
ncbi:hypothetical protein ZIOFF_000726 [Zingiber officinale]|uniref:Phospholipase D C-terminal domain-containing protein n=1 Tax=Zingiber officinale TaxID=94328 RepID=A0A8J5IKA1_ZINOF|nr:hypothetical protein ZIOFF_000726 [Zingiber officinale]